MAIAKKEDNSSYREAMSGPKKASFIAAIEKEKLALMDLNVYDLVDITPEMEIISCIWALQRTQYPDDLLKQLKPQFCARGFKQVEGVVYFKTYSPIVMWMTIRLLLVISILLNLDTTQINYPATLVHAPTNYLVFVQCPKRFVVEGKR